MKRLIVFFGLMVLIGSCTESLFVSSDFDKQADFSIYKTYGWAAGLETPGKEYPMYDNELNRRRIKEAIDSEIKLKGLMYTDTAPDLLVDFHISVDETMEYIAHDNYYPFRYRNWPSYDQASYTVKKGALIIHLVDAKKQQLVWQGVGSKSLADVPPNNMERKIDAAIKMILSQYPYPSQQN